MAYRSGVWNPLIGKPRYEQGARVNPNHPGNRNLLAWWLLNEGGGPNIYPLLGGAGYQGTNSGGIRASGPGGAALKFTGSPNYAYFPVFQPNVPMTVIISFTTMVPSGNHDYFLGYKQNSGWYIDSNYSYTTFRVCVCGQYGEAPLNDITIPTGPFQIAITVNSSTASIYLNGVIKQAGLNYYPVAGQIVYTGGDYLSLGRGGSGSTYGASTITDLRIISAELTAAQIMNLYAYPYGTPANPRLIVEPRRRRMMAGGTAFSPILSRGFSGNPMCARNVTEISLNG